MAPSPVKLHPTSAIKEKNADEDDILVACVDFLEEQAVLQPHCYSRVSCSTLRCSCMTIFERNDELDEHPSTTATANYMVYFAKMRAQ
jgi:hypothetical protein